MSVKPFTNTFNTVHMMFESCESIINIDLSQCTISNSCIYMYNMFKYCSNLETVKLPNIPSSVTNLQECFCYCGKLKSVTPLQIPDACTTITSLFTLCTSLEDISGFTFGSGITQATNWLPPKLVTANNVTIKNDYVNFDGCSTLVSAKNFTFDGTNCDKMFRNCSNLSDVSGLKLTYPRNVGSPSAGYGFFAGCNSLRVIDFSNSNLDRLYVITNFMANCNSLEEVIGLKIPSTVYTGYSINLFWSNKGLKLTNFILGKNSFKFSTYEDERASYQTPIKEIDGITILDDVTDISYLLRYDNKLEKDFEIPSHITNCTETFKGCTKLTHVHSNWDNTYPNGITSTDCYAGCNGITHIDEENVIAYEGDNGLDYVPLDWGGNGFTKDCTTIMEINIVDPSAPLKVSVYTNLLSLPKEVAKVNWGDGSPVELALPDGTHTSAPNHYYAKAGKYIVKAHVCYGNGYGCPVPSTNNIHMTRLLQVSKMYLGKLYYNMQFFVQNQTYLTYADVSNLDVTKSIRTHCMFKGCTSLKTVILPKNMINNYSANMFDGCGKLTEIRNIDTMDMTQCTHTSAMFAGCGSLEELDVSNWEMGNIAKTQGWGVGSMFINCKKLKVLDVSKWKTSTWNGCSNIFQGCESIETIDLSGWSSFSQGSVTSKDINSMFRDCKKLKTVIGLENILDANVTGINYLFSGCDNLTDFSFLDNCDFSSIQNMQHTFYGHKGITSLDLSNWKNVNSVMNMAYFCSNTNISSLDISSFNLYNITNMNYIFDKVPNLTNLRFGYNLNCEFGYSNIKYCTNLTQESVASVLNGLYDRSDTTSLNAEIGSTLIAKLTSEQIAIATNKNWTVI